jgi:hypothetical protein
MKLSEDCSKICQRHTKHEQVEITTIKQKSEKKMKPNYQEGTWFSIPLRKSVQVSRLQFTTARTNRHERFKALSRSQRPQQAAAKSPLTFT